MRSVRSPPAAGWSSSTTSFARARAALVLWPRAARLDVIARAGLAVSLPYRDSLTQAWLENGAESGSPSWHEAHRLAGLILDA